MRYFFVPLCSLVASLAAAAEPELPKVLDAGLKIELFAAEPRIVTPIGIAVDERGRVLVIESHTHFRPANYLGPPADRIRLLEDTDGDGRADSFRTFFEGTQSTMDLALHHDGSLYVATRNEVFRLRDTDGDGAADDRTQIVKLETSGNYPHNGLSGLAFDFAGNLYFGFGENLGATYKLLGSDGASVSGLEGGHIFRCTAEGKKIERLATGFWNPFHLAFDAQQRLFAVDNDPDAMPPCRLLHIVPQGNYGYQFRNGRRGLHPFTAWNGELPGTLPMVAGTGEAPSGLLAYESDNLPAEYRGDLLATSWGDHRIERFHLEPRGASFRSKAQAVVAGGENFRPVGLALAPDGSLLVSDWVDKSYNVHGKGRIWRIRAAAAVKPDRLSDPLAALNSLHAPLGEAAARKLAATEAGRAALVRVCRQTDADLRARARSLCALAAAETEQGGSIRDWLFDKPAAELLPLALQLLGERDVRELRFAADSSAETRGAALRRVTDPAAADVLWKAVADSDPFIQQAAREGLRNSKLVSADMDLASHAPLERQAAVLVLRESQAPGGAELLGKLLADADPDVRFLALQWIGEERLTQYHDQLAHVLQAGPTSARLFAAYLAALERTSGVQRGANDEWAGEQYIAQALLEPKTPPAVRRWALRTLRPDHPALSLQRLRPRLDSADPLLRLEAMRSLRASSEAGAKTLLAEIANDEKRSAIERAEAVVGLNAEDADQRKLLLNLAEGADAQLSDEALRSLRGINVHPAERELLTAVARQRPAAAELVERILEPGSKPARLAAADVAGWMKLLEGPADSAAGERIFFHAKGASCGRCHQVDGRGGRVGPDLSAVGPATDRRKLIESILRPSQEIAPQFTSWLVVTNDGRTLTGLLVEDSATGQQSYANEKGEVVRLKSDDIAQRKPQTTSLMPDGLGDLLTAQEFRDLLAFLTSKRNAPD